jgi:hypothetical protein
MTIILLARHMPQLKGAGAIKTVEGRESGLRIFAKAVTEQLILSNSVLMKGPPLVSAPHLAGGSCGVVHTKLDPLRESACRDFSFVLSIAR